MTLPRKVLPAIACLSLLALPTAQALPNPASVTCAQRGGTGLMLSNDQRQSIAVCRLGDAADIEEWTFFRALKSQQPQSSAVSWFYRHPAPPEGMDAGGYCSQLGGQINDWSRRVDGQTSEVISLCSFSDKSMIGAETLWDGPQGPKGESLLNALSTQ